MSDPDPPPPHDAYDPAAADVDHGEVEEVFPVPRKHGELAAEKRRDLQFTTLGCAGLIASLMICGYLLWSLIEVLTEG